MRFLVPLALLQCCGSSCADVRPTEPQTSVAAAVPHLRTESGTLRLRLRLSKPELLVDCSSTGWSVPVVDDLFGPPREVALSTEPLPLFRPEDRPGSEGRCVLLALELEEGPVVMRVSAGPQELVVTREASGKHGVRGAQLINPVKSTSPACSSPELLSWAETTLTGPSVVEAVEAPDAAGCQRLRLRPAQAAGPSLAWSACVGAAKLPFVAGDPVRIVQNENLQTHTRVLRIERTQGERVVVWLLRGPPATLAATGWDPTLLTLSSYQRGQDCRPALRPGCGSVELGDDLNITLGQRSMVLRSGESASFAEAGRPKIDLFVVHNVSRPVVDPACSKDLATSPADVGVVVIERGGGPATPASPAQIAGPAAAAASEPPAGRAPCRAPGAGDPKAAALACYQSRVRPALLQLAKGSELGRYRFGDRAYLLGVLALQPQAELAPGTATAPALPPELLAETAVLGEPSALGPSGSFVVVTVDLRGPRMPADADTLLMFYVDKATLETRFVYRALLG